MGRQGVLRNSTDVEDKVPCGIGTDNTASLSGLWNGWPDLFSKLMGLKHSVARFGCQMHVLSLGEMAFCVGIGGKREAGKLAWMTAPDN